MHVLIWMSAGALVLTAVICFLLLAISFLEQRDDRYTWLLSEYLYSSFDGELRPCNQYRLDNYSAAMRTARKCLARDSCGQLIIKKVKRK